MPQAKRARRAPQAAPPLYEHPFPIKHLLLDDIDLIDGAQIRVALQENGDGHSVGIIFRLADETKIIFCDEGVEIDRLADVRASRQDLDRALLANSGKTFSARDLPLLFSAAAAIAGQGEITIEPDIDSASEDEIVRVSIEVGSYAGSTTVLFPELERFLFTAGEPEEADEEDDAPPGTVQPDEEPED